jgi:hypothetical protein
MDSDPSFFLNPYPDSEQRFLWVEKFIVQRKYKLKLERIFKISFVCQKTRRVCDPPSTSMKEVLSSEESKCQLKLKEYLEDLLFVKKRGGFVIFLWPPWRKSFLQKKPPGFQRGFAQLVITCNLLIYLFNGPFWSGSVSIDPTVSWYGSTVLLVTAGCLSYLFFFFDQEWNNSEEIGICGGEVIPYLIHFLIFMYFFLPG